jgi:hypothetical protein
MLKIRDGICINMNEYDYFISNIRTSMTASLEKTVEEDKDFHFFEDSFSLLSFIRHNDIGLDGTDVKYNDYNDDEQKMDIFEKIFKNINRFGLNKMYKLDCSWPISEKIYFCLNCYRPYIQAVYIEANEFHYHQSFCSYDCMRAAGDTHLEEGKPLFYKKLAGNHRKFKYNHSVYDKYEETFTTNEIAITNMTNYLKKLYLDDTRAGEYYPTKIVPGVYILYEDTSDHAIGSRYESVCRVGKSNNIAQRLSQYVCDRKIDFYRFTWYKIEEYEGQSKLEDIFIKRFQPKYNVNQKD